MASYGLAEFQSVCADVRKQQLHSLRSILTSNLNTKRLRDSGIVLSEDEVAEADVEALLRDLPLTTYADYQTTLERALEAAERGDEEGYATAAGELLSERPDMLCCTTGTTGAVKLIPRTALTSGPPMQAFAFMDRMLRVALHASIGGKELRLGWRAPIRVLPNGVWVGAVTACGTHKFLEQYDKGNPMVRALFGKSPSPVPVLKASDPHTTYYMHWLFSLLDRHSIVGMSGTFASEILSAVNILLAYQDCLLRDVAEGRLGAGWDTDSTSTPLVAPSDEILAALGPLLQPNPDLATELREIFAAGRVGLLERLFPQLQSIKCICTGSMAKYVPALRQLAPSAPLLSLCYGATEATLGVSAELVEYAELLAANGISLDGNSSAPPAEPGTPHQQHDSGAPHRPQSGPSADGTGAGRAGTITSVSSGGRNSDDTASKNGLAQDSPASRLLAHNGKNGGGPAPPSPPQACTAVPSFQDFISGQDPGQASYILVPDAQVYLEFLPLDVEEAAEGGQPQLVRMHELQVGQLYEVVVTNMMGFYRYRMGDRVRCVGDWKTSPKVVIEGRTTQDLNLSSEKVPDVFLRELVHSVAGRLLPLGAAQITDWAARECLHTTGSGVGHYIFYWELNPSSHKSSTTGLPTSISTTTSRDSMSHKTNNAGTEGSSTVVTTGDVPSLAACAAALDAGLATPNSIYKSYRRMGRVGPVELRLVTPGSFAALAKLAFDRGASPGQFKPPVVLTAASQIELLDGRVVDSAVAGEV